jgi:hypothetical protein
MRVFGAALVFWLSPQGQIIVECCKTGEYRVAAWLSSEGCTVSQPCRMGRLLGFRRLYLAIGIST